MIAQLGWLLIVMSPQFIIVNRMKRLHRRIDDLRGQLADERAAHKNTIIDHGRFLDQMMTEFAKIRDGE